MTTTPPSGKQIQNSGTEKSAAPKRKKRSARYEKLARSIDPKKHYPLAEALELAKKSANTRFTGSIEVHIRLGIDPKKSDQQIRTTIILPHGTGKKQTVAAFVPEGMEKEAKEAGADIVGGEDLIENIRTSGKVDFEIAVAVPEMMPKLARIAKILGPRGLMPSPKNDTITTHLSKTLDELKKGKIYIKNDDTGNIHCVIGKASFELEKLIKNFETLFTAVKKAKPPSAKGAFVLGVSVNATMGPGIPVALP